MLHESWRKKVKKGKGTNKIKAVNILGVPGIYLRVTKKPPTPPPPKPEPPRPPPTTRRKAWWE